MMLQELWKSKHISLNTKVRIFNTNVKAVLLYGAESWKYSSINNAKIQSFANRCLRKMVGIWWPNKISNEELWKITKQDPIEKQIQRENGVG